MRKGWLLVFCYIIIVLAPFAIAVASVPAAHKSFFYELGKAFALTGIIKKVWDIVKKRIAK